MYYFSFMFYLEGKKLRKRWDPVNVLKNECVKNVLRMCYNSLHYKINSLSRKFLVGKNYYSDIILVTWTKFSISYLIYNFVHF